MKTVKIKSPTTKELYSVEQLLKKFITRSSIEIDEWDKCELHKCFYGSKDGMLSIDITADSQIGSSTLVRMVGQIPYHVVARYGENCISPTSFGKWLCRCDTSHHGQFPSQAGPSNPDWDKYKKVDYELMLIVSSGGEEEEMTVFKKGQEEYLAVITEIIKRVFMEIYFLD